MKRYIALSCLLGIVGSWSTSCSSSTKTEEKQITDSLSSVKVERAIVGEALIDESEVLSTTLEAKAKNNITAQAGGRLTQLYVKLGDQVARGQLIARLDATQLSTAQIQVQDAKLNAQRMEELYKIGGISQAQWEQARSSLAIAEQQLNNIQSNTTLRSPISGFVTAKNYDNGDMTSPTLPIVVVEQITPVKAIVNVSERLYSKIKKGLKANIETEAFPTLSFDGYISNIAPNIDTRTHSLNIEVEFPNKDQSLRPGMYGRVRLDLGQRTAIVVPDKAVQRSLGAGVRYVYVIKEGKAVYREVQLGAKQGDKQEIISGLELGEEVVLSGFSQISNGKSVK